MWQPVLVEPSVSSPCFLLSRHFIRREPEKSELQCEGMAVIDVHERYGYALHCLGDS